jgi:UDP-2-acetamido-3-amino-2,3-dideoxy-glucuronate N-acetyltransferase
MIHPLADVKGEVGAASVVMQFAVVEEGARIGERCVIGPHCFVGTGVVLGDDVHLEPGVRLVSPAKVGVRVKFGPNVSLTDLSGAAAGQLTPTTIADDADIEANVVLYPGIAVGLRAHLEAGSIVRHNVPSFARVAGNPSRIVGYVDTGKPTLVSPLTSSELPEPVIATSVKGVTLHRLPLITDIRGGLTFGEFGRSIPLAAKRYFVVLNVPSVETRGEHAHRKCAEFLVCVTGQCSVVADDGHQREEFLLNRPTVGILLPPMVWRVHYKYSEEAVLMVFASEYYDASDYIRDYAEFQREVSGT